jgi:hypothetical protein
MEEHFLLFFWGGGGHQGNKNLVKTLKKTPPQNPGEFLKNPDDALEINTK